MSPILLFITALSCGWLAWSLWCKASPARRLPDIPLVEFDGNNPRERYTSDAASLLGKGYDTVRTLYCHLFTALSLTQESSRQHIRHGRPFCIRDFLNPDRPRVFLPLKYMEEVRNAPQESLSLPGILNYVRTTIPLSRLSEFLLLTSHIRPRQ